MANILIYDTGNNRAKDYLTSVNTPDYSGRNDVLINPVLPDGVPLKYMKVEGGIPLEMTQAEKDVIDAEEAAAARAALLAQIDLYNVSNLDLLTALVKRINVRIPANPITKAEIIQQIKDDLGV